MSNNITSIPEHEAYREIKVGRTLYRVTSIYKGEIELNKALEDLTVKRVIQSQSLFQQPLH